ncbi:MAG: hypothetical protein ACSLFQ_21715 [Thermoanaerobaculia bacterium]
MLDTCMLEETSHTEHQKGTPHRSHNGVTVCEVPMVLPARSLGGSKMTMPDAELELSASRDRGSTASTDGDSAESERLSIASRAEHAYAAVALLLVAFLHVALLKHGGALWRDEINSVAIARADTWSEIASNLEFDSFPAGWFALIRPVATFFGPTSALAWRIFGFVVGLLLAAAVTIAGIGMTGRAPVLAINLALLSAIVIRFGDSVRGFGAGTLLAVLAYWALFRYAEHRTRASAAVALAITVASVQILYHNAFIVFGACCAAAVVCLLRGAKRAAVGAIAIGSVAAASLVPYVSVFRRARTWNDLLRWDIDLEWIHRTAAFGIRESGVAALVLWYVSLAVALAVAARTVAKRAEAEPRLAFHATALVLGGIAYVAFLHELSYYTAPWYYLPLLVVAAMACDALVGSLTRGPLRVAVMLLLCAQLALSFIEIARYVARPATNVPETAAAIARETRAGDLVLVWHWELGISWKLYYDGPANWSTVPLMPLLDWHRFDLYRGQFGSEDSARAIVRRIDQTLAAGHRVLVVSWLDRPTLPGPQPAWQTREATPLSQVNELLRSRRYRVAVLRHGNEACKYERVSVLELHAERKAPRELESPLK